MPRPTGLALQEQIDRIFKAREYKTRRGSGRRAGSPDGTAYAIVERPGGAEGSEIVRYDAATGARRVLVPSSALVPAGAKAPLDANDYA